jgi:hypothetical protein
MVFFFKKCRIEITPVAKGYLFEVFNSNQTQIGCGFDLLAKKDTQVFQRAKQIVELSLQKLNPAKDIPGTVGKDLVREAQPSPRRKRKARNWFDENGFL